MANNDRGTELINKLMTEAFHPLRNPRSHEYRTGARSVLELQINGRKIPGPPSCNLPRPEIGTVQADAWFAGVDEGWAIWRKYQEQQNVG